MASVFSITTDTTGWSVLAAKEIKRQETLRHLLRLRLRNYNAKHAGWRGIRPAQRLEAIASRAHDQRLLAPL
jgi:hypothetical protein